MTAEEVAERARADEQDAALFVVAAFSGLRLGELLALRWRNVRFADAKLIVEASWTAGQLTSPKWRAVPLADQPAAALAVLAERERFTGPRDLVFCSAVGDYVDPSALLRRYRRSQPRRAFARCASTTFATPSAASSSASSIPSPSTTSWVTPRSRRPSATSTRAHGVPMPRG